MGLASSKNPLGQPTCWFVLPALRALALATAFVLAAGLAGRIHARGAEPTRVEFNTEDGFTIYGDIVTASDRSAPVAILLHMYRSNRAAWTPLVPELAASPTRTAATTIYVLLSSARLADGTRRGPSLPALG